MKRKASVFIKQENKSIHALHRSGFIGSVNTVLNRQFSGEKIIKKVLFDSLIQPP